MKKSDLFWQSYLNLERSFLELSTYIFITDTYITENDRSSKDKSYLHQLDTFSPYIADLLVQCCIQIEAISKELYYEIVGTKNKGDKNILFDMDCLKEIDKTWNTHDKIVIVTAFNLSDPENKMLRPLNNAHKHGKPYWKRAYQSVKHDRYNCLFMGNIKALLNALSALYLLNIYYRKDSWITRYQDINKLDMSCGSKIFAVNPPKTNQDGIALWDTKRGNIPIFGDSPYIVTYTNEAYRKITNLREEGQKKINEFICAQPEANDQEFIEHISKIAEEAQSTGMQYTPTSELMKFRLKKRIPQNLPFQKRKELLINSEEWKGRTYSNNKHLQPEEITEENIDREIDNVGRLAGIDIEIDISYRNWIKLALTEAICEVRIPTLIEAKNINV